MWLRNLLLLALVLAAATLVRRALAAAFGASAARAKDRPSGASGGARAPLTDRMVRDRVCNTFLPESKALRVERDGAVHHFCSARCRDAFLAGTPEPSAAAPGGG